MQSSWRKRLAQVCFARVKHQNTLVGGLTKYDRSASINAD